ncbi:MAG TPA: hypothetical protein DEG71_09600 [Clostridiales bacterium]|nr:hypothetical protein [Clostridiales bacterium]
MVYRGVQIRTKEDEDLEIETFIGQIIKSPGIEFHNGKGGIEFTKDGAITMGSGGQGGTVMVKGGTTFKNGAPLEETQSKKAKQERNFPCSCGSGIKYKYCCGNKNKKI